MKNIYPTLDDDIPVKSSGLGGPNGSNLAPGGTLPKIEVV